MSRKEIIILGAGGHAAEIDEYFKHYSTGRHADELKIVGFLDDDPVSYSCYDFSAPFLGEIVTHNFSDLHYYLIGIANMAHRERIINHAIKSKARFLTFIHSQAYVSESAHIGLGNIIGPYANIGPNVYVGDFNLVNARASLGHDTSIGDFNFISPNVSFSGYTKVGNGNLFGINSATIPGIRIGDRNKIMAGMVLDREIGNDTTVFYRFKERIIATPK